MGRETGKNGCRHRPFITLSASPLIVGPTIRVAIASGDMHASFCM